MANEKKYYYFSIVFEKELKKWLKEHNSQKKVFALDLGIRPEMIGRYLNGNAFPKDNTLQRMADMFGIEKEKLIYPSEEYTIDVLEKAYQEDTPAQIRCPLDCKGIRYGNVAYITYPDNSEIEATLDELNPIFEKIASYGNYLFDELKKTKQNRKDW